MQEEFEQVKVGDKVTMDGANTPYFTDRKEHEVLCVDGDGTARYITDDLSKCYLSNSKKYLRKVKPKFNVGQVWKTRGGEEATLVSVSKHKSYPLKDTNKKRYTPDGKWFESSEHRYDLVELIKDVENNQEFKEENNVKIESFEVIYGTSGHPVGSTVYTVDEGENSFLNKELKGKSYCHTGSYTVAKNIGRLKTIKQNKLKLEVGKSYITRDGKDVVKIIKFERRDMNFAHVGSNGDTYTETGLLQYNKKEREHDLVKLVENDKESELSNPSSEDTSEPVDALNGLSASYYDLPTSATQIQDLIEHKEMNFSQGNILKAIYRLGNKSNVDAKYDLEKIVYFAQRELDRFK